MTTLLTERGRGIDLSKLRPPETAPTNGDQFIAWAVDNFARHRAEQEVPPRWMVIQWSPSYRGGTPFWQWAVPGRSTGVTILGWLPLGWNDQYAEWALGHE